MQIIWVLVGVSSYAVMSLINYHFWMRYAHYLYGLGLLALCMVFLGP